MADKVRRSNDGEGAGHALSKEPIMKMPRALNTVGLVIVLVISVVGSLWGILSVQAEPPYSPPQPPTPEVLGNGWNRYVDTEAGYSISYPPAAILYATDEAGLDFKQVRIVFPVSTGRANQSMSITVFSNSERSSIHQIIEHEIYQGRSPKKGDDIPLELINVAGLQATKMEMAPFFPAVLISAKNRIYFVSLPMDMMWGDLPTPDAVDLFYKIINTFSLDETRKP